VLHLHVGDGVRGLDLVHRALEQSELPTRVFHPTHVNRRRELFEEARTLARQKGLTVDVTAFPIEEGDAAMSAEDAIEAWLDSSLPRTQLTVSSDGGGCLPTFDAHGHVAHMDVGRPSILASTLAALVSRGRALGDVLPFFTSNVARVLRMPRKGHVVVGGDADLVVLGASGAIRYVLARGRVVVRDGAPVVRGTFETAA
jgi:beta-aspartyl-dipeptidase (metallo-type)